MDEIISAIVANGLWAVLFCGLLVYELRDSRKRESRYTQVIGSLAERLEAVNDVKADTEALLGIANSVKADTEALRSTLKKKRAEKPAEQPQPPVPSANPSAA